MGPGVVATFRRSRPWPMAATTSGANYSGSFDKIA